MFPVQHRANYNHLVLFYYQFHIIFTSLLYDSQLSWKCWQEFLQVHMDYRSSSTNFYEVVTPLWRLDSPSVCVKFSC